MFCNLAKYPTEIYSLCQFNLLLTLTARKSIPTTTHQSTEGTTEDLTTFYSSTSQEAITTFHLNVVSNTSHTSNVTTEEATTADRPTTPNTTDLVSNTTSTELNNAATKMSTVTATQQIPTTTALITRSGISTFTTLKPTSADTTSPSLTLKPTETSHTLLTGIPIIKCLCGHFPCIFLVTGLKCLCFSLFCLLKRKPDTSPDKYDMD